MNTNESFKAIALEKIAMLVPSIDTGTLRTLSSALDMAMQGYTITRECTSLTVRTSEFPDEVKQYLVSKKIEGLSDLTIRNRTYAYRRFFISVQKPISDITANDVRVYLWNYKRQNAISDRSLDGLRIALHALWTWLVDNEFLTKNIMHSIKPIRYEKKQRVAMNQMELEIYRHECRTPRESAILEFFYSTACRCSELCNVRMSDIDWVENKVTLFGKGRKQRFGYLNAKCIVALRKYLADRCFESEYLFASDRFPHGRLSASRIQAIIRELEERVGTRVSKHVTPHIVRHTTATQALMSGMPIEQIQTMLGHASVATTQIYAEVSQQQVQQSHIRYIV